MVVYDFEVDEMIVYDGCEMVLMVIDENLFVEDGEVFGFFDVWQFGKLMGVFGVIVFYKIVYDVYGILDWVCNFDVVIQFVQNGFEVMLCLVDMFVNECLW